MKTTAVVINSSPGGLALGLQMAGFQILADYEISTKDADLCQAALKAPVYLLSEETVPSVPREVDLLAAQIGADLSSPQRSGKRESSDPVLCAFSKFLLRYRPHAFFLAAGPALVRSELFEAVLKDTVGNGYQVFLQVIDTGRLTGFPVVERKSFVVGLRTDIAAGKNFQFPMGDSAVHFPLEPYLTPEETVDPWYFQVSPRDIPPQEPQGRLYCWRSSGYTQSDHIVWNPLKVPLIWTGDAFRKITLREIANLKGFPADHPLPEGRNRQQHYFKFMSACNVLAVKQIGDTLQKSLADNSWEGRQVAQASCFEDLFYRGLINWADTESVHREPQVNDTRLDFAAYYNGEKIYFELKFYRNTSMLAAKLKSVCQRISSLDVPGHLVLVVANEVPEALKETCRQNFQVSIWDVGNLLWLFEELPKAKSEFIALLDYAVDAVEPKPPKLEFAQLSAAPPPEPGKAKKPPKEEKAETTPDWQGKLDQIKPGKKQFAEYEAVCTEILKYTLGDCLTLWKKQECSNADLYRFDLCCKIKFGVDQDFFDTVKNYFNTKYIVFEFKNYNEAISQKEIYTTEKYLYEKALRKVAIIVSRKGADEHALRAARGCLRENGKLILCLSDQDLLEMIGLKEQKEVPAEYLNDILDDLLVHLEK